MVATEPQTSQCFFLRQIEDVDESFWIFIVNVLHNAFQLLRVSYHKNTSYKDLATIQSSQSENISMPISQVC